MKISERFSRGWNAFMNKDPTSSLVNSANMGYISTTSYNPGTILYKSNNTDQSIVDAIINKIAVDVASVEIIHCKLDDTERFSEKVDSRIQNCLELEANIDQGAFAFRLDLASSILEWGVAAICPIDVGTDETDDPNENDNVTLPVNSMRVGRIVEWAPQKVKVNAYNELTGYRQDVWFNKSAVCVIQNPFFDIMNRPNSALRRLKSKLQLADILDEQSANNKFNMIIQMPYSIKTPAKEKIAENRIKKLETQLAGSKYGIGYVDATEHITQLNRALDNHIIESIEYYQKLVFDQLGMTPEILNGTASEEVMNNYYTRINEPILVSICEEIKRKWLSKTARSQKHSIEFYRDPFKLLPVTQIPEIADKLTRNEIMTSNEIRQAIGMRPSKDPKADELRNKNLSEAKGEEHVDIDGKKIAEENVQRETE